MKKTRQRYDRDFKISVVDELESSKPLPQIAREHGIHPSVFLAGGETSWTENARNSIQRQWQSMQV